MRYPKPLSAQKASQKKVWDTTYKKKKSQRLFVMAANARENVRCGPKFETQDRRAANMGHIPPLRDADEA
jgi:hypothetical protein